MSVKALVVYAALAHATPTTPLIIVEPRFVDALWCEENSDFLVEKFLADSPNPSRYLSITVRCVLVGQNDVRVLLESFNE